jgi:hypothetical protein
VIPCNTEELRHRTQEGTHQKQNLEPQDSSETRTAQIQLFQGAVGLERLGQRLSTCIANLVGCDRPLSAQHHSLTPPRTHTLNIQPLQGAIGLERPSQCLSTGIANLVGCNHSHSAPYRLLQQPLRQHTSTTCSGDRSSGRRTNKIQPLQSAVGQERRCQCLCALTANLIPCNHTHSEPFVAFTSTTTYQSHSKNK